MARRGCFLGRPLNHGRSWLAADLCFKMNRLLLFLENCCVTDVSETMNRTPSQESKRQQYCPECYACEKGRPCTNRAHKTPARTTLGSEQDDGARGDRQVKILLCGIRETSEYLTQHVYIPAKVLSLIKCFFLIVDHTRGIHCKNVYSPKLWKGQICFGFFPP